MPDDTRSEIWRVLSEKIGHIEGSHPNETWNPFS